MLFCTSFSFWETKLAIDCDFYSAFALLAMQSAVLARAIMSVRPMNECPLDE